MVDGADGEELGTVSRGVHIEGIAVGTQVEIVLERIACPSTVSHGIAVGLSPGLVGIVSGLAQSGHTPGIRDLDRHGQAVPFSTALRARFRGFVEATDPLITTGHPQALATVTHGTAEGAAVVIVGGYNLVLLLIPKPIQARLQIHAPPCSGEV